jgi:hypothetical protein
MYALILSVSFSSSSISFFLLRNFSKRSLVVPFPRPSKCPARYPCILNEACCIAFFLVTNFLNNCSLSSVPAISSGTDALSIPLSSPLDDIYLEPPPPTSKSVLLVVKLSCEGLSFLPRPKKNLLSLELFR